MNILPSSLIILLSLGFLIFPSAALINAREGLIYFGLNMVPALFPFMVLTNLAMELNITRRITFIIHPLTHLLFHTDYEEDFCILTGLLCGFPMGAIALSSQIKNGRVSLSRARRLLAFICLPGPVYIASLVLPLFSTPAGKITFLSLYYGIPLLMGVLLCTLPEFPYKKTETVSVPACSVSAESASVNSAHTASLPENFFSNNSTSSSKPLPFPEAFQKALNQSLHTILNLGGIVILFYTFRIFLTLLPKGSTFLSILSSFFLEINGGTAALTNSRALLTQSEVLLYLSLFPFCGLSCLMQVMTVIKDTGLRIRDYLIPRIIHFILFLGIAYFLTKFFPHLF